MKRKEVIKNMTIRDLAKVLCCKHITIMQWIARGLECNEGKYKIDNLELQTFTTFNLIKTEKWLRENNEIVYANSLRRYLETDMKGQKLIDNSKIVSVATK